MNIGPTGGAGEDAALEMLLKNGFELVARNYHTKFGEIDLIVKNVSQLSARSDVQSMVSNAGRILDFLITPP